MKYALQCRYSMINETFIFQLSSIEPNTDYKFEWWISNIDKPIYALTNNNIVFKAEIVNDLIEFSVVSSDKPIKEKLVHTKTVPILNFETDENIEIIYDYSKNPSKQDKFVGEIISEMLELNGGGFLENINDYEVLEKNIAKVINKYNKTKTKSKNTKVKKPTKKQGQKK